MSEDYSQITSTDVIVKTKRIMELIYPQGYLYKQLYNPTTNSWEKSPEELFPLLTWSKVTDIWRYPFLFIHHSATTQAGSNGKHSHTYTDTWAAKFYAYTSGSTTLYYRIPPVKKDPSYDQQLVYYPVKNYDTNRTTASEGGDARYLDPSNNTWTTVAEPEPSHTSMRLWIRT